MCVQYMFCVTLMCWVLCFGTVFPLSVSVLLMVVSWVAFKSSVVCRGSSYVAVFSRFSLGSPYVDIFCIPFAPLSREFWAVFNYRKKTTEAKSRQKTTTRLCCNIVKRSKRLKCLKDRKLYNSLVKSLDFGLL